MLRIGFPSGLVVKNLSGKESMREMHIQSLGQKDPLEKEMASNFSILA